MAGTRDYNNANAKTNAVESSAGYSDFDINFVAHPISGDIAIKRDSDAIKRSVRNIILTNHYERPFKPNFGANLRTRLFEISDGELGSQTMKSIGKAIMTLEPRIKNLSFSLNESKFDNNTLDVTIFFEVHNIHQQQELGFSVSRVR